MALERLGPNNVEFEASQDRILNLYNQNKFFKNIYKLSLTVWSLYYYWVKSVHVCKIIHILFSHPNSKISNALKLGIE